MTFIIVYHLIIDHLNSVSFSNVKLAVSALQVCSIGTGIDTGIGIGIGIGIGTRG